MIIWVNIFQTESISEIYSKSPVRAIGKELHQLKHIKVMKNGLVCKETAVLVVRINNIGEKQCCFSGLLAIFRNKILNFYIFFSFEYFGSFDHYAACYVPSKPGSRPPVSNVTSAGVRLAMGLTTVTSFGSVMNSV